MHEQSELHLTARLRGRRLARGEPSDQTEPSRTTPWLCQAGPVNRLAEDLAQALSCPVELTYLPDTQEVVAVACPEPGREVRVTVPASPIWLRSLTNPFFGLKYDLLNRLRHQIKQLRHQTGQPGDG